MQKLKIGLLINDFDIPYWEYKMIERIAASDHSEIRLIVRKDKPLKTDKLSFFQKLWKIKKNIVYFLYVKVESKLFKPTPNAFHTRDLRDLIDCPVITVSPKKTKFSDIINKDDIKLIQEQKIDVFIRFGFRILRGDILKSAKYGVWSYHHGNNSVNRGGPPGVWEVFENWNTTGAVLQILTEDLDGGLTLTKTHSSTDSVSILRNKNNYYWNASSLVPRKLKELYDKGGEIFMTEVAHNNSKPNFYYNRLYVAPTNKQAFKAIFKTYKNIFIGIFKRKFFFSQWILLYKFEKENKISKSFFRFKRITPPKDRFWADPFVVQRGGK